MYHTPKTGSRIPIVCMEDSHLLNTIKYKLRQIQSKRILPKVKVPKSLQFILEDYLYDQEDLNLELIEDTESLYPYVFYACLRPTICDEVLVLLQDTFNDKDEV